MDFYFILFYYIHEYILFKKNNIWIKYDFVYIFEIESKIEHEWKKLILFIWFKKF